MSTDKVALSVEDDACPAFRYRPVVGLVKVVVQTDDGASLPVSAVPLDHFPAQREPASPVRFNENTPLVPVPVRFDDEDVLYGL
jgi:hypothetical protein